MDNSPNVPFIELKLDQPRKLILDFNAMAAFERETGRNALTMTSWRNLSATDIRVLVWACALRDDPEFTLQQAGAALHPGNMTEVITQLDGLWGASMPEAEGDERPLAPESPRAG